MVFTQEQISEFYSEEKKYYELFKATDNVEWYNSTLYPISGGKIEEELSNFASKNPLDNNNNTVSSKWKHANVSRYATGAPIFKEEQINNDYYAFKDKFLKIELEYLKYNTSYYLEINGYDSSTTEVNAHRHFYFIGKTNGLQYRPRVQNIVSKPSDEEKIKAIEAQEVARKSQAARILATESVVEFSNQQKEETQSQAEKELQQQILLVEQQKEASQAQSMRELERQTALVKQQKQQSKANYEEKYKDFINKQDQLQKQIDDKQSKKEQELQDVINNVNNKANSFISPILDEKKIIQEQLTTTLNEANTLANQKNNELNNKMIELINSVKQQNQSIQESITNSQTQLSYNNELVNRLRNGI